MKNIIFLVSISSIFLVFIFLNSCDKIEGPYIENNDNIDTSICPATDFPVLTNVTKKILIEDFTGHKCGYCPRAHTELANLISTYPNRIIGVAYHVSDIYASPSTPYYSYEFRTVVGNYLDQTFHMSDNGLPQGMINRIKYNGSFNILWQDWGTIINPMINEQPEMGIQIMNDYNSADSSFCTHIKITFLHTFTDTLMMFCGVMEDSIIKPQRNYDSTTVPDNAVLNYVHMHAFRKGLNGNIGSTLNYIKTVKDSSIIKSYFLNLKGTDYIHKNLKIFAYVYKNSTNEVLQAEEKHLIE
jgi:hypothetical protein